MAVQTFQRQLQQILASYAGTVTTGFLYEAGNKFYIPITYDNFTTPDLTPSVNATVGQSKLVASTAGAFDNVRIGDIVESLSGGGALTALTTVTHSCYAPEGQMYVVYPSDLTSVTLNVQAGDAVTSLTADVVPASTVVDKIDYNTRRIFLSNAVGVAGDVIDDLTFAAPARVTSVRPSTSATNANEIDIDTTVSTGGSGLTATIVNGAREAVSHVVRLEPISNTTGSKVTYTASVSVLTGTEVKGAANGLNNINVENLNYTTVGSYSFDGDSFLINARLPRPASI